ncbi:hypothetical protein RN001_012272 [Aquatica leii]|uniref:ADP-ribosylation factor-like protein 8B n=1 Tax=Aquatica leii TaxID=1421715 RepID=A0AAN7SPF0_9COLE|nr:hypothetical protein RN001_012272 [Aquatica leii]
MLALMNRILDWFRSLFWKEEMELTLVGLQYSGKTTFVNVIASGQFSEDMIPTVGFNMRKITKGNVTIKVWDIGGQPRFRSMWERYCRGVNAIVYMVDAADPEKIEASRNELHNLLDKPQLAGIPVLVLGNKRDLPHALDENGLIERMNLSAIQDREICCYSISCKEKDNIDITLQWLIAHSKSGLVDLVWDDQNCLSAAKRKRLNVQTPTAEEFAYKPENLLQGKLLKLIGDIGRETRALLIMTKKAANTKREIKDSASKLRSLTSQIDTNEMWALVKGGMNKTETNKKIVHENEANQGYCKICHKEIAEEELKKDRIAEIIKEAVFIEDKGKRIDEVL